MRLRLCFCCLNLALTSPWPCFDHALTLPWPSPDILTLAWPCFYHALMLLWQCLDLTLIFLWPCPDSALTLHWWPFIGLASTFPYLALTLPWPFHDLALNLPWTCLDFALMVKIGLVTAEILMIRTNVARKYVAWSNVILTVGIYLRWYKELKPLKFGQNWISNSWDIADVEFLSGVVVWCKVIFVSDPP